MQIGSGKLENVQKYIKEKIYRKNSSTNMTAQIWSKYLPTFQTNLFTLILFKKNGKFKTFLQIFAMT